MHFPRDGLAPPLDSELASMVECMPRESTYTRQRRNIENQATAAILRLTHHLDGLEGHTHGPKEVGLELIVHLRLRY